MSAEKDRYFGDHGGIDIQEMSPYAREQRRKSRENFEVEVKKGIIAELKEKAEELENIMEKDEG
jgi:hypothetical protein